MGSLPAGIPVEIEMILEVSGGGPARKPARAKASKKSRKRR
jgi:hypothetical protein